MSRYAMQRATFVLEIDVIHIGNSSLFIDGEYEEVRGLAFTI